MLNTIIAACLLALSTVEVLAQAFPARPIRMIVPYPPGGAPDIAARLLSQPILESTGQQLIVDNRAGAGALIGAEAVARAAPDGYTLLIVDSTLYSINPNLSEKFPYEILRDFTPITLVADTPILLAANVGLGVENLPDYLALARAKPGLPYGSSGQGTAHHLAMELLAQLGRIQLTHVPYKGASQSVPAVIAGDVTAAFAGPTAINPQVRAGKMKVLGMTALRRSNLMPDIPTLAEAGLPGYEMRLNMGILGPGKMPAEVVARLNSELVRALNHPEVKQRLAQVGQEVMTSSPQAFAEAIGSDREFYARLIKSAGLKMNP
jgi:tripartite-type tricarboxylate transporter receptor subunit TctC